MPLKIYQIEYRNSFPYEQAVAVRIADLDDPITLDTQMDTDRMHRVYSRHPYQHVTWALVEGFDKYDYSAEKLAGKNEDTWVQIDYTIFGTHHRPDDKRIGELRQKLQKSGLKAVPFPAAIRPDSLHLDGYEDAFHSYRLEGDLHRKPYHLLYVSKLSDIPTINHHTIPEDLDFAWVTVQIATYRRYDTIPSYREILGRLEQYVASFDGLIA